MVVWNVSAGVPELYFLFCRLASKRWFFESGKRAKRDLLFWPKIRGGQMYLRSWTILFPYSVLRATPREFAVV